MSVVRLREFGLFVFQVSKVTRQFFFSVEAVRDRSGKRSTASI